MNCALLTGFSRCSSDLADGQVLKNHDSDAPVNFTADRIEVQDRADRVVVSGNVEVTQAGMTLNAARMTVAYRNQPGGGTGPGGVAIDRIDASGHVVVCTADKTAKGHVASYERHTRLARKSEVEGKSVS